MLEVTENRSKEFEDKSIEFIQLEQQREKKKLRPQGSAEQ